MENSNALTIVNNAKAKGALVYVDMQDLAPTTELFRPEPQEVFFDQKQFHNIQGRYQPDKAATDRMGELGGVNFIEASSTEKLIHKKDPIFGERDVWIATAQGKKLCSDGSWRTSPIESYEFDPCVRAMDDMKISEVTDANRLAFLKKVIEYSKFALARAKTGARLRVIRFLLGLPSSFTAEEIKKPMVFNRVVMNTAFVLSTPEGRTMATAKALGVNVSSLLYGNKPDPAQAIAASPDTTPAETAPENLRDANEPETEPATDTASLASQANPSGGKSAEDQKFEDLTVNLEALLVSNKAILDRDTRTGNPYKLAKEELESFAATIESRKAMTSKISSFLEAMKKGATA